MNMTADDPHFTPTRDASTRIERARRGEEDAWEELFNEHYPRVFRFFRARVADAAQAEDLASNVFLQAFRSIERFTWQGKPFRAWLFGIARHELASYYRSLRPTTDIAATQHAAVRDEFLGVEVRDILERIPSEYRTALELRYVIGLSGVEAAAAMGRSHGAFRSLLLRAVRAYRAESAGTNEARVRITAGRPKCRRAPERSFASVSTATVSG